MPVSPAIPAQKDNLFGICAALGEDFGFDPLYLRIALSVGILWNPLAMFGGYLALGIVVLATRLLVPNPQPVAGASVAATRHRVANTVEPEPELLRAA